MTMGDVHIERVITLRQEIEAGKISESAAMRRWKRNLPELTYSKNAAMTPEQLQRFWGSNAAFMRKAKTQVAQPVLFEQSAVREAQPITGATLPPIAAPAPRRVWYSNIELTATNVLAIAVTAYGLVQLFGYPGAILSAMVALYMWKTQGIARNAALGDVAISALEVVAWIEVAAFFLHCVTFWNAIAIAPDWLHAIVAALPAAFISYISYSAVSTTAQISQAQ